MFGVFFSILWPEKCKCFLKRDLLKITEIYSRKMVRTGDILERQSFSFVTAGQDFPGAFMVVANHSQVLLAFGIWPLKLWDCVRRSNANFSSSVTPTLSSPGCSCSSGHPKHHSHGRSLTHWIWHSSIQQVICVSLCQQTFGTEGLAHCWKTLKQIIAVPGKHIYTKYCTLATSSQMSLKQSLGVLIFFPS